MNIEVVRPIELSGEDRATWARLQTRAGSDYSSPFLSAGWAIAVDRALERFGEGLKVAVVRDGDEAKAFFACRAGRVTAMPAGAPISDYQAMIAEAGFKIDPRELLQALGVQRYDFCHMVKADKTFGAHAAGSEPSYVVDVSEGWEAYEAGRKAAGTDILKDIAKKTRKVEREVGPVVFTAHSRSRSDFDRLFQWKREHFERTRQTDVTSSPWVKVVLEELFESRDPDFGGILSTMHFGDRLAAAQFNLRGAGQIHSWFIGHDEQFERLSPGLIMFGEMLKWMADSPYRELDLGPVAYRFKDRLANRTKEIAYGFVGRPGAAAFVRAAEYRVRQVAEALPLGRVSHWPGKAMRRLDRMRALG